MKITGTDGGVQTADIVGGSLGVVVVVLIVVGSTDVVTLGTVQWLGHFVRYEC